MKIMIVSDSHGEMSNVTKAIKQEKPIDILIHCGDTEGTEGDISLLAECPIYAVRGNNDYFTRLSRELEFEICGRKVMVTHGHYYSVSMGPERLIEEASARGLDIVFYGHTHRPLIEQVDGMYVVNPGSIAYPRQEGRKRTYAIMNIDKNNKIGIEIKSVD